MVRSLDFFFLIIFSAIFQRPDMLTKISHRHFALSHFMILNQLPIRNEVIVKHRFLVFACYTIPFNIVFLLDIYFIPLFFDEMSMTTFLVFSVIWICFSFYLGLGTVSYEAGIKLIDVIISIVVLIGLFFVYYIFFFKLYNDGLISWTIHIATDYPLLSILTSISLAVIGWKFWSNSMLNRIKRFDYV